VIREHFELGETALTIIADEEFIPAGKEAVFDARASIEAAIASDPYFASTWEPIEAVTDDRVIRRMCSAAAAAEVGPMAAVAGTVAWEAVEAMRDAGAGTVVADNGGDIALVCERPVTVGIYSGGPLRNLGLSVGPRSDVLGICSSSAKVGHSISLGESHVCTVVAEDVSLADAFATALGNMVASDDVHHLQECVSRVASFKGVKGAMANIGENLAMAGDLPRLVRVEEREALITRRSLNIGGNPFLGAEYMDKGEERRR